MHAVIFNFNTHQKKPIMILRKGQGVKQATFGWLNSN